MDVLFNKTIDVLSGMLDYRTKRHKVIVSNVTNLDTPDFKPSDMTFKSELGKKGELTMATTDPGHILPGKGSAGPIQYEIKTSRESGKIDTEMANLAENHLMYNMTVEMLARKFKGLNTVLKETR